jgi:hypothetical protein
MKTTRNLGKRRENRFVNNSPGLSFKKKNKALPFLGNCPQDKK